MGPADLGPQRPADGLDPAEQRRWSTTGGPRGRRRSPTRAPSARRTSRPSTCSSASSGTSPTATPSRATSACRQRALQHGAGVPARAASPISSSGACSENVAQRLGRRDLHRHRRGRFPATTPPTAAAIPMPSASRAAVGRFTPTAAFRGGSTRLATTPASSYFSHQHSRWYSLFNAFNDGWCPGEQYRAPWSASPRSTWTRSPSAFGAASSTRRPLAWPRSSCRRSAASRARRPRRPRPERVLRGCRTHLRSAGVDRRDQSSRRRGGVGCRAGLRHDRSGVRPILETSLGHLLGSANSREPVAARAIDGCWWSRTSPTASGPLTCVRLRTAKWPPSGQRGRRRASAHRPAPLNSPFPPSGLPWSRRP